MKGVNVVMNVSRTKILFVENCKILIILTTIYGERYKLNTEVPKWSQVTFGEKNIKGFGAQIWNNLIYHVKSYKNVEIFKKVIKSWNGSSCKSLVCDRGFISF